MSGLEHACKYSYSEKKCSITGNLQNDDRMMYMNNDLASSDSPDNNQIQECAHLFKLGYCSFTSASLQLRF